MRDALAGAEWARDLWPALDRLGRPWLRRAVWLPVAVGLVLTRRWRPLAAYRTAAVLASGLVRLLGASLTVAIDTDERRRTLAEDLGADDVLGEQEDVVSAVRELTDGRGVDLVFDFVGTDETHERGLQMLARRGVYSVIGYGGTISLPSVGMIATETAIAGNLVGNWIDLWELLQLHAAGRVTLKTETHPLDSVNDVLEKLRDGEVTGRAVLVPS